MMSLQPHFTCAICKKAAFGYNYGVPSCNACKMFFRRANDPKTKTPIIPCDRPCTQPACRFCRLQLCLNAGMSWTTPLKILQNLIYIDSKRHETFSMFISMENLSLDQVIMAKSVKKSRKPLNFLANFYDWATIDQISAIEFMKAFDFIEKFSEEELKIFIKSSYIQYVMFCIAMRAVGQKSDKAIYPDGVDVFPEEITSLYQDSPELLKKVRCPLVAKIIDLKVTREEFVLLSAIIICNPVPLFYSNSTRNTIAHHQRLYSFALLQHCLLKYQPGPSRFSDLLSLCNTINTTFEDFGRIWIRYLLVEPNPKLGRMYMDFLEYILKK